MSKGDRPKNPKNADVEIEVGARARELRFKEVPETEVRFWGSPGHESASGSDRENLPDTVERGVPYRNGGIWWRAASKLDVDDRLLKALDGEEEERERDSPGIHNTEAKSRKFQ